MIKALKKTALSLLCIIGVTQSVNAQLAVADPANLAVNTANKVLLAEQVANAVSTLTTLKEMRDVYREVSSYVKAFQGVKEVYDYSTRLTTMYSSSLQLIDQSEYLDNRSKNKLNEFFTDQLEKSAKEVAKMKSFLTGDLKMNDAERIILINDINKNLKHILGFMAYVKNKIRNYNSRMEGQVNLQKLNDKFFSE